ncbi:MAG TPA: hypothetical protein VHZ53_11740 [Steroidobacteraceae bacterium]|jgi:hypothetical protein|nr:hypothetical protein [Steroidobacteraceae bacterium]
MMLKALLIIGLVVAVLGAGLAVLRRTGRTGVPGDDVLHRAAERARKQAAEDEEKR